MRFQQVALAQFALSALLCLTVSNRCAAQWSWNMNNDGTNIWLQSTHNGQAMFDYQLGAGGAIGAMRDNQNSNQALLAQSYAGEATDRIIQSTAWSQNIQNDIEKSGYQYYDRFNLTQGGTGSGMFAPTMQVMVNPSANTVDVYSVARDQWLTAQQPHIQSQFSSLTRYEMKDNGVLGVRRVIRVGDVTLHGSPTEFEQLYLEAWTPFRQKGIFDSMTRSIDAVGNIDPNYSYKGDGSFPMYPGWRVEDTEGYAVVYKAKKPEENTAVGVVFGKEQVEYVGFDGDNANNDRFVLNSMGWDFGSDEGIAVLPGIEFNRKDLDNPVLAGSIIDQSFNIVPRHALDGELAGLLTDLVGETPAPILYSPDYSFSGELAGIVAQLNTNLTLTGARTNQLGGMAQTVFIQAVPEPTSMLVFGTTAVFFALRRRRS